MNTPIEISTLTEYIDLIDQLTAPGASYLYRGQENAEWQVTSSAYRRLLKMQISDETSSLEIQTEADTGSLEIQTDVDTDSLPKQADAETGLLADLFTCYLKQIEVPPFIQTKI